MRPLLPNCERSYSVRLWLNNIIIHVERSVRLQTGSLLQLAEIILTDCGAVGECGVHRVDNALYL